MFSSPFCGCCDLWGRELQCSVLPLLGAVVRLGFELTVCSLKKDLSDGRPPFCGTLGAAQTAFV